MNTKMMQYFSPMAVKKGNAQNLFSNSVPSFIRDWFLARNIDANGNVNTEFISKQIAEIMPKPEKLNEILNSINSGSTEKILTRIKVCVDISKNIYTFELPDYNIKNDKTIIPMQVWNAHKDELLQTTESFWGVVELSIYNSVENKKPVRKIALSDFTSFNPFKIDLNYYVKARSFYTVDEWLDILIGAIDFNPEGFDNEKQKLTIMYRLIPFVQERVNLVELAPKGTAKSYVYSKISKKAWSVTGGSMTRAKMFYDISKRSFGLAAYYDVIAFDEIASMTFADKDMQGALKNYLEYGTFSVGNALGKGTAGLVLLGNIAESQMNSECNMFDSLPNMFKDSALIDRFHGFIRGWDAKRMEENMKMNDWALSSEYIAEIMHALRSETVYSDIVDKLLIISTTADTRDTTAIKRITTALIKLLFPHWTRVELVDKEQFEKYCVIPAIQMRETIRGQMALIDTEFRGKTMPTIQIKKD